MTPMRRITGILTLITVCAACTGPEPPGTLERYRARNIDLQKTYRIAVLPIEPGPAAPKSAEIVADAVTTALSAHYDVVRFERRPTGLVGPGPASLLDDLLEARNRYAADALLQSRIIAYQPFQPPSITMSLRMVSATNGQMLWKVAGTIDSARPEVERRAKEYFDRMQQADDSLCGWHTMLLAERRYAQFVADEFLLTVSPISQPRRQ